MLLLHLIPFGTHIRPNLDPSARVHARSGFIIATKTALIAYETTSKDGQKGCQTLDHCFARVLRPRFRHILKVQRDEGVDPEVDGDVSRSRGFWRSVEDAALDIFRAWAAVLDESAIARCRCGLRVVEAYATVAGRILALLGQATLDIRRIVRAEVGDGEG